MQFVFLWSEFYECSDLMSRRPWSLPEGHHCVETIKKSWLRQRESKATFSPEGRQFKLIQMSCWALHQNIQKMSTSALLSVCVLQASSVLVTRQQKGTTGSWIRFKLSAGSVRTSVTLEETRVASQFLDLELAPLVSACSLCRTTQRVRISWTCN